MVNKPPVFIVGIPRSGTTLLAAMLAAHKNMSCGPETHFFPWIQRVDTTELTRVDNWPGPAVDFLSSIIRRSFTEENPKPLIEKYGITRNQIENYLSQHSPSIGALLSSITETHMHVLGKGRWVEKTPDHIKHLAELRSAFPDAYIIRILRDPRDIALSLSKVPWGVQSFFEGLTYWKSLDQISSEFFSADQNTYSLRFEDLVVSPKEELSKLCEFIGESFDENMLDTSHSGKQLNSYQVPWKEKASQPIDRNRIFVWQKEIRQAENQLAEAYLGDLLVKYRYQRKENLSQFGYVFPGNQLIPKYELELQNIAATGVRFWQKSAGEEPDVLIFLGDPADSEWSYAFAGSIFPNRVKLVLRLLKYKLSKRKVIWVLPKNGIQWTGSSAQVIKSLLAPDRFLLDPR